MYYFKIMCKPYLRGSGDGALESLNKQDNKSSDAIEKSEGVVRKVVKEVTRISLYLEIQFLLYLLRETWSMLKAVIDKG
jgi:signal transduction histidine kinase